MRVRSLFDGQRTRHIHTRCRYVFALKFRNLVDVSPVSTGTRCIDAPTKCRSRNWILKSLRLRFQPYHMFNRRINCRANGAEHATRACDQIRVTLDYGGIGKTKASREKHLNALCLYTMASTIASRMQRNSILIRLLRQCSRCDEDEVNNMCFSLSPLYDRDECEDLDGNEAEWSRGYGKRRNFSKGNASISKITEQIISIKIRFTELNKSRVFATRRIKK